MASYLGFQNDERSMKLNEQPGLVKYAGFNGNALLYAVVATATTGFSLFGYDQGLMSGIIGAPQFNNEFPATRQPCDTCNDVHVGTVRGSVTACYEVGCFFGALFAFWCGERLGRRRMAQLGGIVMILGTIITVSAFGPGASNGNVGGFVQFIIGRVVTGLGNGANTATLPSWVAECAKPHNRGFLICIEASTVAVGTVIAYWVDFGLSYVDSSASWRFPMALQILFAIIMMAGVSVLPESPRWLMKHGYNAEASRVIAALAGTSVDDKVAVTERNLMSDAIAAQARVKASAKDLLKSGKQQNLRRALVGASTQLFQQLGGCNAVIYYSTILFEENIGLEHRLSLILGGVLSCVYALFALSSFFLVERVGRRKLFLIGTFGQGASMFITFATLKAGGDSNARGGAVGLFLFIAFFGATWLPLPWLYPAELNSMAVRTQANAISTMTNWLSNFLVVQVLPTMTASIDSYTFLLFAIANMIFLQIPPDRELTFRSLEELDVIFAHAHLTERRPTIIAEELPKLTPYQVATMTERYDIHGGAADAEADGTYGAAINAGQVDTTLPPADGNFNKEVPRDSQDHSESNTRVPTPDGAQGLNEKTPRA